MRNLSQQQAFDDALSALRKQGKKAVKFNPETEAYTCLYRAPDGSRCAIGHLIPDSLYNPGWEGHSVSKLGNVVGLCGPHPDLFLEQLQRALHDGIPHDMPFASELEHAAEAFAEHWDLTYTPLLQPEPITHHA